MPYYCTKTHQKLEASEVMCLNERDRCSNKHIDQIYYCCCTLLLERAALLSPFVHLFSHFLVQQPYSHALTRSRHGSSPFSEASFASR